MGLFRYERHAPQLPTTEFKSGARDVQPSDPQPRRLFPTTSAGRLDTFRVFLDILRNGRRKKKIR